MSWLWGKKKAEASEDASMVVNSHSAAPAFTPKDAEGNTGSVFSFTTSSSALGTANLGHDCDLSLSEAASTMLHGSKGCPENISCVHYHVPTALLFISTTNAELFAYGNGFQVCSQLGNKSVTTTGASSLLQRLGMGSPPEIVSMHSVGTDLLLLVTRAGTLLVVNVHSVELQACMEANELARAIGMSKTKAEATTTEITEVHVDTNGGKPYAYIGYSTGHMAIIEIEATSIRVCDFKISGLMKQSPITCIAVCPKDDRYLAIAQCLPDRCNMGKVIIYDVRTHKFVQSYSTGATVRHLEWCHTGAVLFAALGITADAAAADTDTSTKGEAGDIVAMERVRNCATVVWSVSGEAGDDAYSEGDSDDNASNSNLVSIRSMKWMSPQRDGDPSLGCLFVLVCSGDTSYGRHGFSSADKDNTARFEQPRSAVVVLQLMQQADSSGSASAAVDSKVVVEEALSVPPTAGEEAMQLLLVPTVKPGYASGRAVPSMMMVTQDIIENKSDRDGWSKRQIRILPCPDDHIDAWALEIGTLPDARRLSEVLPLGCSHNNSNILYGDCESARSTARVCSIHSLSIPESDNGKYSLSRTLSDIGGSLSDETCANTLRLHLSWPQTKGTAQNKDIVFTGNTDGSVTSWEVTFPHVNNAIGASLWKVIRHFPAPGTDGKGPDADIYGMKEMGSSTPSMKASSVRSKHVTCIHAKERSNIISWADASGNVAAWEVGPGSCTPLIDAQLENQSITALIVVGAVLLVGTKTSKVYYGRCDEDQPSLRQTMVLAPMHAMGAVTMFWSDGGLLFCLLSSGQCAVLNLSSKSDEPQLVSFSSNPMYDAGSGGKSSSSGGGTSSSSSSPISAVAAEGSSSPSGQAVSSLRHELHWEQNNMSAAHIVAEGCSTYGLGMFDSAGNLCTWKTRANAVTFVATQGRCVLVYDLKTLIPAPSAVIAETETCVSSSSFDQTDFQSTRIVKHRISQSRIISAVLTSFDLASCECSCDSSNGSGTCSRSHIMFMSTTGTVGLVSLVPILNGSREVTPSSTLNLLDTEECIHLRQHASRDIDNPNLASCSGIDAVCCNNSGNAYIRNNNGHMIRQICVFGNNFQFESSQCDRNNGIRSQPTAYAMTLPNNASDATGSLHQLLSGREARIAKLAKKVEKRRASMFNLTILKDPPTDINEVYSKSKGGVSGSQSGIIEEEDEGEDEGEGDDKGGIGSQKYSQEYIKQKSNDAMSGMRDARQNLEERGEKLSMLAEKGEAFQNDTHDFKKSAAEHRKQLEASSRKWGLF